jgi:hypothetical protein
MPGTRIITASLLLCSALGAQTVWLPLDEGNVWVYRASGAGGAAGYTVRVDRAAAFGSQTYYSVVTEGQNTGFISATPLSPGDTVLVTGNGPLWLRNSDDGRIMMWDERTSSERVYLDTAAKPGGTSESSVDPCNPTSTVVSREAKYSGPIGDFDYALQIRYGPGGCADAGLESDFLLPWVGIVSRTAQTIAGPRRYDLVYARLGTATVISAPELTFSLTIDRPVYTANLMPPVDPGNAIPRLYARMTLRNTTASPVKLEFATGQMYEMVLWNDQGKQIWRWSDGRAFTQAFHAITVSKSEKIWTETIRLAPGNSAGIAPLPEGRYVLECWLTTTEGRTFTASVPLTLSHVH